MGCLPAFYCESMCIYIDGLRIFGLNRISDYVVAFSDDICIVGSNGEAWVRIDYPSLTIMA